MNSGDWLLALPISACGLRLDDEAVRTATKLRLGVDLCVQHECPCGTLVTGYGLSCRLGHGRTARHALINDITWRGLIKAGFPATREPCQIRSCQIRWETPRRCNPYPMGGWQVLDLGRYCRRHSGRVVPRQICQGSGCCC